MTSTKKAVITPTISKNPEYLLLDEAISSLAAETFYNVQKGVDGLAKGQATVIVARHLSTVMKAG